MMKNAKLVLLAGLLIPGMAMAEVNVGDTVGTSEADIRKALEAQGYSISEFEIEDGEIEVEVTLNGQAYEVEVSTDTGKVLEIEKDDESDTDDS